jgi:hypothetical protein
MTRRGIPEEFFFADSRSSEAIRFFTSDALEGKAAITGSAFRVPIALH